KFPCHIRREARSLGVVMARGEEGLQVLRNHFVEHRIAGITRCVGGNRWRHTSPHRQQGEEGSARSCPLIYCSNVQYTSKKLTWECGGNMRGASPCCAAVPKSAFKLPSMLPLLSSPGAYFLVVSLNCRDEVLPAEYHTIRASQGTKVP